MRKPSRWTRKVKGSLVSLARDDNRPGWTEAVTAQAARATVADLLEWAADEFPGRTAFEVSPGDGFIGITIDAFV